MIFAILLLFSGRDREFYRFKIQILFLGQQQKLLIPEMVKGADFGIMRVS